MTGGRLLCRAVAGDARSFGIALGDGPAVDASYSQRLLAGEIPNVVRDTAADERTAHLQITADMRIGSYLGVPLRFPDGTLYGTVCALGHAPDYGLDDRHARFLSMLAELIVCDLVDQRADERLRAEIERLIASSDVEVAYQPIFELGSDRCLGIEALARFPEPFIGPAETFAAAEEVGLAAELERLVIGNAWDALERLGPGQFLALNVSPAALLELAGRVYGRSDLPLSKLVLEVTEHAMIDTYDAVRGALAPLRRRGLRIAVDDAGAGYASLRHVLELRPDFIKLDRWLIDGLADDSARRVAVSAFVSLARELGSSVIAEGVERPADLATVRELGLDAAQGYLLGRPTTDQAALSQWCEGGRRGGCVPLGLGDPEPMATTSGGAAERVALERERERVELDRRVSHRLEAVGQLAAGIAHEINTPLQFVGDSVTFLRDAVDELVTLTGLYRETLNTDAPIPVEQRRRAMREAEEQADVEYLCERIPAAFARTADGIARVRSIVQAMKRFSHTSSSDAAPADINEAIETTLAVCRNEYKYVATVALELADLPAVACNIGEINQVFLNLILNAAQAIEEKVAGTDEQGEIAISTRIDGSEVVIEFTDDGGGIPPELQDRIYEPFFTTKELGKGTGQGLALARSTIERHSGSLSCVSALGRGTTFAIRLPLHRSADGLAEAA